MSLAPHYSSNSGGPLSSIDVAVVEEAKLPITQVRTLLQAIFRIEL